MAGSIEIGTILNSNEYSSLSEEAKDKIINVFLSIQKNAQDVKSNLEKLRVNSGIRRIYVTGFHFQKKN